MLHHQPGDVIYHPNYEIQDPITEQVVFSGPKLFVVLHNGDPSLLLKTTSKRRRYPGATPGCRRELKVFMIEGSVEHAVQEDTFVELPKVWDIPKNTLDTGAANNKILRQASLSRECFRLLIACLKHFRRDISLEHQRLIF